MKALKVTFSIINGVIAIAVLALCYSVLTRIIQDGLSIKALIVPLAFLFLFSLNVVTNWKKVHVAISVIQALLNLLIIPIYNLTISIALPLAMGILTQINPEFDAAQIQPVLALGKYVTAIIVAISVNIVIQAFKKENTQEEK
jgi:hypothetical protein